MSSTKYVLLTDSCCDLPAGLADELELSVVPLSFTIGGAEYHNYLDEREIKFKEFYDMIRQEEQGVTSAVNMSAFISIMEPVLESGRDILYLAFSSALSNTCSVAEMAAAELSEKYPERKVYVVDTLSASMGQGLLVYLTALKRLDGKTIDEAREFAQNTRLSICHWFTVDSLHHLHRGGRVSKTTAIVGSMLNIKPVLHVDNEGRLINMLKARGTQNSLKALLERMDATADRSKEQTVFISHSDAAENADILAGMIKERFNVKNIVISYIGPVIGSHTGSGTIALFFEGIER